MSKELEALYRLATRNSGNHRSIEEVDKDFKIIEQALIQGITDSACLDELQDKYYELKQTKSKKEQAWDIVKKKQVDLGWLWYCIHECVNSLNEYNKKMPIDKFKLTEEEFELLKESVGE